MRATHTTGNGMSKKHDPKKETPVITADGARYATQAEIAEIANVDGTPPTYSLTKEESDALNELEQAAVDAEDHARLRRAEAQRIADEIKHGITPDKATVPTQIRVLQSQLDDLKVISGLERTNISSILRVLIAEYILAKREDPTVQQALDWAAGGRKVMAKLRAEREQAKKNAAE